MFSSKIELKASNFWPFASTLSYMYDSDVPVISVTNGGESATYSVVWSDKNFIRENTAYRGFFYLSGFSGFIKRAEDVARYYVKLIDMMSVKTDDNIRNGVILLADILDFYTKNKKFRFDPVEYFLSLDDEEANILLIERYLEDL